VQFAHDQFRRHADEISATMVKHQLKLADCQCRMAELSARIQDTVTILVTALWGHRQGNGASIASADSLRQYLRRKLTGERPSDQYFNDVGKLADLILSGGFETITGVPRAEIMMTY
jgi:acyl-CoA dehydrogenase